MQNDREELEVEKIIDREYKAAARAANKARRQGKTSTAFRKASAEFQAWSMALGAVHQKEYEPSIALLQTEIRLLRDAIAIAIVNPFFSDEDVVALASYLGDLVLTRNRLKDRARGRKKRAERRTRNERS